MTTLKDIFLKHKSYIVEFKINKYFYLFIEGLDNYGGCITSKFDISKIATFCIELFKKNGEYIVTIDSFNIGLTTSLKDLKKLALKEIIYI